MTIYECDCCGRKCSRIHHGVSCGMDYSACDLCVDYEWDAYGEDADPLLFPPDPLEDAWLARQPDPRDTP